MYAIIRLMAQPVRRTFLFCILKKNIILVWREDTAAPIASVLPSGSTARQPLYHWQEKQHIFFRIIKKMARGSPPHWLFLLTTKPFASFQCLFSRSFYFGLQSGCGYWFPRWARTGTDFYALLIASSSDGKLLEATRLSGSHLCQHGSWPFL